MYQLKCDLFSIIEFLFRVLLAALNYWHYWNSMDSENMVFQIDEIEFAVGKIVSKI